MVDTSGSDVSTRAEQWLAVDPDPDTRAELRDLITAGGVELEERFAGRLAFGTAGLRGALGAGPTRMNRVVVRQTTAGIAACLAVEYEPADTVVVIGRDARHKSDLFAHDAVAVLAAAGFDVRYWADPVPTPLLAYAARLLDAAAGIQITASHNPARDNGYKVYWSDGGQIRPDVASRIAAAIDTVATPVDLDEAGPGRPLPDVLRDAYRAAARRLLPPTDAPTRLAGDVVVAGNDDGASDPDDVGRAGAERAPRRLPAPRDLSIVYTPLHGVAGDDTVALLSRAGFRDVAVVDSQFAPDPDFPTVGFPNPEEDGALAAALALAGERGADLVLANDPDGDRIAAAVPTADGWRLLSGDEIGCLLAEYLLEQGPGGAERVVATTVVSSQMLERIAAAHGVAYAETLTGFKWLADAAKQQAALGRRMVLAYEEALGVMIGDAVRDKDGISAALMLADCADRQVARGAGLTDILDDLAMRHGLHAKAQSYVRSDPGDDVAGRALARLREHPPSSLAGATVTAVSDFARGRRHHADGTTTTLTMPPTKMMAVTLDDGSRVQVRPSGTEPKLKFYVEVVEPVGAALDEARARADARLEALVGDLYAATGVAGPSGR